MRVQPVAFLFLLISPLLSLPAQQQPEPASASNTDELLNRPDHHDVPWGIWVSRPILTYQQRYLVAVSGWADAARLRRRSVTDITAQLRVADGSGQWLPGSDTTDFHIPPDAVKIRFLSIVYALPGDYRVAISLFDRERNTVNVKHRRVRVPNTAGNVLPGLTRGLPAIEFPARLPGMDSRTPRIKDRGLSLAHGTENLPIITDRPVLIDVLLDFSEPDSMDFPFYFGTADKGLRVQHTYYNNARLMMQIGSVLSHLQPTSGRVRVSALNMSRLQVLLDRQEAATLDWAELEDKLYAVDFDRVDPTLLASQRTRSIFTDKYLAEVASDSGLPGAEREPSDHVVVLVAHHLQYPRHTPVVPIQPQDCPGCRFLYLRLTPFDVEPLDPYRDMLKPLHPRSFRFATPEQFRRMLPDLLWELSKTPKT